MTRPIDLSRYLGGLALLWPTIDTLLRPGQPGTTVVTGNRLGAFPRAIDGIHIPQKRLGFFSLSSSFFLGSGMQRLKSPESTLSRIDVGVASHACRANGKSLLTAAPSRVKIPSPTNDRPPELSPQAIDVSPPFSFSLNHAPGRKQEVHQCLSDNISARNSSCSSVTPMSRNYALLP